jgi:hypothetical protein
MSGGWLFSMKYTALPHAPFLFQPFFLLVGLLARITGAAPPVANLLAKAIGTVLFGHVWFRFVRAFQLGRAEAWFATAMMAFASGLGGWIALFSANAAKISADLWLVDLNTYWSLLWNTRSSDVVFARPGLSSLIPAVSGNTVIWGHWAQSVDVDQRVSALRGVFSPGSGLSDAQRSGEFWSMGMKYLLVDPWFRQQLLSADAQWLTGDLRQLWESGATGVYQKSGTP